ncbi:hypothetical protein [Shewanella sp. TB7-MNA-CIBAN-0143]|uniref:hypothetical protein n=1 Tax=Shewanella sp. TB7-MNA-CIBAN-0143 TaxID=3140465 RepID=UPI003316CFD3
MSFFKFQGHRIINAFFKSAFWKEIIILIPFSMVGIWWPVWFDWPGYSSYLLPAAWFTFGIGSLVSIMLHRSFMTEDTDRFKYANTIVVILLSIIGGLFYGKALSMNLQNKELDCLFLNLNFLEWAIVLNVFVWIWNLISTSDFDSKDSGSPLGENHD